MKKILLSLIALMATLSINAQIVNVYENGSLSATYTNSSTNIVKVEAERPFVEIGGVKWATMNLGATTVAGSPSTCYGDYYAWGETEPRYTSITISGANSASFGGWSSSHSSGYTDNDWPSYTANTLDAAYDPATQNWGSAWRTPTKVDFEALVNACTGSTSSQTPSSLTTSTPDGGIYKLSSSQTYLPEYTGVAGILFVDKTDTSKRVFFPATGSCRATNFYYGGSSCEYWSSSLNRSNTSQAYELLFYESVNPSNVCYRFCGLTIRPVCCNNGQVVKVYVNGALSATYTNSSSNPVKVVFEENYPDESRGTAAVSGSAGIEDNNVKWVQLWENGPKWAVFNVGAKNVSEYGSYYYWGSTGISSCSPSTTDIQGTSDDTAKNLWGDNWQMPTKTDLDNLKANCTVTWTTQNGLSGNLYTGKGEYSSNNVFFPAAGVSQYGRIDNQSSVGYYWSSTSGGSAKAYRLDLSNGSQTVGNYDCPYGCSVRAILYEAPEADLLDVVFNEDGSAYDASPRSKTIESVGTNKITYYNANYNRYMTNFQSPWAGTSTGYYKVDFESDEAFRSALADGHTLEILVKPEYEGSITDVVAKPFSAMEYGGTGFQVSTISGSGQNELTFLPNVTESGSSTWRWTTSGVVPQSGTYYHVVGVWNKEEKKSYIYVNGQLKNTIDAPGDLRFASSGNNWFAIGGDPSNSTDCSNAWKGDIAIARVYDQPLNSRQVEYLYNHVTEGPTVIKAPNLIPGKFSVSDTKQVQFTKGNLYYSATDGEYHLESEQNVTYATLGQSEYDPTHVCHFHWSNIYDWQSSGMEPWALKFSSGERTTVDRFFCTEEKKMTVDGTEGLYALSDGEWHYLFGDNTARSGKYACGVSVTTSAGTVENCVVIAPDACIGSYTFDNTKKSYTAEEWTTAEAAGLVCLPAAGRRNGSSFDLGGEEGIYWSASPMTYSSDAAYYQHFLSYTATSYCADGASRSEGYSVRLVSTVSE